jgi:hypothetical protein
MKRGLYYRPQAKGYTSNIREAWIVSEEEADVHVYRHGEEQVTMHRAPAIDYCNDLHAMHEVEKTQVTDRNAYRCEPPTNEPRPSLNGKHHAPFR